MEPTTTRALTPSRIVALTLIAAVAAGLAFLGFRPENERIAVPAGAKAGDLALQPCEYTGENGAYPADCGTLIVPENRDDPASPLIALPVVRVRAVSQDPKEPVFFLTGGPGQSNMDFDLGNRYPADRDFVLVGYRGVDGSVRMDCPEVDAAIEGAVDILSDEAFRAYEDGYRSCADRLARQGVDAARYGMVQQVDDLEAARRALGYERINLLSESAGTRAALIYAWRHPQRIHRSVMVGVNPPGAFLWDPEVTDEQIGRFSELCAQDDACGARTPDLSATMRRLAADLPDRWLLLPIEASNVRVVSLFGLFETASTGMASAPMLIDTWLSAAEGDPSGLWLASVLGDLLMPDMFVRGQYAAAAMLDAEVARASFADGAGDLSNLGRAATAFGWGGGRLADAWPQGTETAGYREIRTSEVETLVVNGELDVSTPPQISTRGLMPHLPNGHEVVLEGIGHTASFFQEQAAAGTHLVNTFLDEGRVDDSRYRPQALDFTPPSTFTGLAKIVVGALAGMAALSLLWLLALAGRVRARGRIGPRAGALTRSILAPVLGLGGWSAGVLLALATMPGVAIAGAPLVVTSVALSVGLAVGLAGARGDRSMWAAVGVALAGAAMGAWLGFHAADALLAILTAVAGSVAGANLVLILTDLSSGREGSPATGERRAVDVDVPTHVGASS